MSHEEDGSWKLDELAREASISPRTVRYYVQRGLLAAPAFRGKDTAYTREHLVRLRAIKRLQEHFFPLDAIQAALEPRSLKEIERIAEGHEIPALHGAPEPIPTPRPSAQRAVKQAAWVRYGLAKGLELHVSEEADDETRALAEEVRRFVERRVAPGGSSR